MDAYLLEFLSTNWITMGLVFGTLKSIAVSCGWSEANSILETIQGMFFSIKDGNYK